MYSFHLTLFNKKLQLMSTSDKLAEARRQLEEQHPGAPTTSREAIQQAMADIYLAEKLLISAAQFLDKIR